MDLGLHDHFSLFFYGNVLRASMLRRDSLSLPPGPVFSRRPECNSPEQVEMQLRVHARSLIVCDKRIFIRTIVITLKLKVKIFENKKKKRPNRHMFVRVM